MVSGQVWLQRKVLRAALALPASWQRRLFGAPPRSDRDVELDPRIHTMLTLQSRVGRLLAAESPAEARRGISDGIRVVEPRVPAVARLEAGVLAGRPVRLYAASLPDAPLLLWLHGGGWAAGDLDSHDGFCRRVAAEGAVHVVSLDYRLAPEHPFPAGLDDAVAAWTALRAWAEANGLRPARRLAGGDSAGGNLATALCTRLEAVGQPGPDGLLLVYPGVDFRRDTASHALFSTGFLLDKPAIDRYERWYQIPSKTDPLVSPLLAATPLPPSVLVTAGFDPLRDEGEALRGRFASVEHVDAVDQVHGFLHFDTISPSSDAWVTRVVEAVGRLGRTGVAVAPAG